MKRFSIVNNGYNIDEVNNFIDIVIRKLEKLSADNTNYLMQLEELKKQVANNNSNNSLNKEKADKIEQKVTKALLAAQETTDKMKELAKEEANLIIKEAKENANAIIHEALINAEKTEQQNELLKKNYYVYKTKIESLVKAQLELLNNNQENN